ncbi:hypothetical protein G6F22_013497 [Rhizopus arrhizus]|nr:hypothetical protein G6F22_013497 [Rhizopus arrhizus]
MRKPACRAATTPVPGQRGHRQQGRADAQAGGLPAQCDGVIEAEHIPGQVHRNVQHQAAPQGVAVEVVEPGEDQATEGDHRTDEQRGATALETAEAEPVHPAEQQRLRQCEQGPRAAHDLHQQDETQAAEQHLFGHGEQYREHRCVQDGQRRVRCTQQGQAEPAGQAGQQHAQRSAPAVAVQPETGQQADAAGAQQRGQQQRCKHGQCIVEQAAAIGDGQRWNRRADGRGDIAQVQAKANAQQHQQQAHRIGQAGQHGHARTPCGTRPQCRAGRFRRHAPEVPVPSVMSNAHAVPHMHDPDPADGRTPWHRDRLLPGLPWRVAGPWRAGQDHRARRSGGAATCTCAAAAGVHAAAGDAP